MTLLNITDSEVYAGLIAFIATIVPSGTPIVKGQQNRVAMPNVPCVVLTTLGATRRIGTNADSIEALTNTEGEITGFEVSVQADFEYTVQADFYSPDAESWAMAVELVWRDKIAFASMPAGMKPLYSEGRQQLPIVAAEDQWIQRWTMTLVLDYQPIYTQATQAATVVTVIPKAIDVFFPSVWTSDSDINADSDLKI
jgi:hypothetical protein